MTRIFWTKSETEQRWELSIESDKCPEINNYYGTIFETKDMMYHAPCGRMFSKLGEAKDMTEMRVGNEIVARSVKIMEVAKDVLNHGLI